MKTQQTRKYVSKAEDIPTQEHYAILLFSVVRVPNSYGPDGGWCDEPRVEYVAYFDRESWEAEIKAKAQDASSAKTFRAIHVKPATVKVSVEVS